MKSACCSFSRRMEVAVEVIRTKADWLTRIPQQFFFFLKKNIFCEIKSAVAAKTISAVSPGGKRNNTTFCFCAGSAVASTRSAAGKKDTNNDSSQKTAGPKLYRHLTYLMISYSIRFSFFFFLQITKLVVSVLTHRRDLGISLPAFPV